MKRSQGFTIVELLIAVGIIAVVAGIAFPIFVAVKRNANRATCISNLKQYYSAISLYRESCDGMESGLPSQMGLPPDPTPLYQAGYINPVLMQCTGNYPGGSAYTMNWPFENYSQGMKELWARYVRKVGPAAILMLDANHQSSYPRNVTWQNWTALGLQLDGAVIIRTHLGYPLTYGWWHL